jgi:aminoglycoside 3-N-acetyltransferase
MLSYREVSGKLQELNLPAEVPLIVHARMSSIGEIHGGVDTMLGALFTITERIMVPTFTCKTMVIPEEGPTNNAMEYGSGRKTNSLAEVFNPKMPVDKIVGILAEKFRQLPNARRTTHPLLSFSATNFDEGLKAQTKLDPLGPIRVLADEGGWILLIGVDQTSNTTIHYGERMAGRKDFVRWAATVNGICECPGYPGCSDGFNQISQLLESVSRQVNLGDATITAIPAEFTIELTRAMILSDPYALLCQRPTCPRCDAVREEARSVAVAMSSMGG